MQQAAAVGKSELVTANQFCWDILEGLGNEKKSLPPKYFYDELGSHYFDQICELEEYYPYKTELKLLPEVARAIAPRFEQPHTLIEFGAGSLHKVQILLRQISGIKRFVPIDISGEHLSQASLELANDFPGIEIEPCIADFSRPLEIAREEGHCNLGFFPGSTIGNFKPTEAREFLANASRTLGEKSWLLIGVDTKKSPDILHKAYNDGQGVTAKFNRNILRRIGRHFDTEIDLDKFEHYAFYNAEIGRVEMHLVCLEDYSITLDGQEIPFQEGESIHTENSYKYSPQEFKRLANQSNWQVEDYWLAQHRMFSIYLLRNFG